MAKEQNLALNPTKISGQCGRLLCCLDYEYEAYCDLRKNFPKCGKKACTAEHCGSVEKMNLLTGELTLRQDDGKLVSVHLSDLVDENSIQKPAADREQKGQSQPSRAGQEKYQPKPPKAPPAQEEKPPVSGEAEGSGNTDDQQIQKKKKRNRRHSNRKNRDPKNDSTAEE